MKTAQLGRFSRVKDARVDGIREAFHLLAGARTASVRPWSFSQSLPRLMKFRFYLGQRNAFFMPA
jgi:hypothetical protein